MSDSSTENSGQTPEVKAPMEGAQENGQDQKVPVAALAKERAEKRAAREEADTARSELEKFKNSNPEVDLDALSKVVAELTQQTASAAVEQATAPLRKANEEYKMAMEFGLNKAQADAVTALREEVAGLTPDRAIALLKTEKPELFPSNQRQPADLSSLTAAGLGGNSPYATEAPKPDFQREIGEALKAGDRAGAQRIAEGEFLRRAKSIFGKK